MSKREITIDLIHFLIFLLVCCSISLCMLVAIDYHTQEVETKTEKDDRFQYLEDSQTY
jgi:hypothetical protein